jgi:hypothetical protein
MGFVQGVGTDSGGSGGTFTATFSSPYTLGNTIIVVVCDPGTLLNAACSDDKGNTYTRVLDDEAAATTNSALFVAPITTGGGTVITVTGSTKTIIIAVEESGLTATPIDQSHLAANLAATNSPSSGSVTPTSASEVGYAFVADGGGTNTFTQGTGWTAVTGTGITSGQHTDTTAGTTLFVERMDISSTAAIAGTATTTGTPSALDAGIVTLFKSGGGGGGPPVPVMAKCFYIMS